MSGGSFDYLGIAHDLEDVLTKRHQLGQMRDELVALHAEDAATETEELELLIRQLEVRVTARLRRLQPVWKAVEWFNSSDWGRDSVDEALKLYRQQETP